MPRSNKIVYHCDCQQFCKGKLRKLGQKAYFAHAMHRKCDTQSNPSWSSEGPWSGTTEGAMDPPDGPQSGCAHHSSGESSTPSGMPACSDILDSEGGHAPLSGNNRLSCCADDLGNMQPAFPNTLHDSDPGFHLPTPPQFPPGSYNNLELLQGPIPLCNLRTSVDFIKVLQDATLSDPSLGISPEALGHLCNPPHELPCKALNPDLQLAIDLYLGNASEAAYETN